MLRDVLSSGIQGLVQVIVLSAMLCTRAMIAAEPLPNILIMMADDMGLGDTSAYQDWTGNAGSVQVLTPSMERLARMGVRFTDAHSPSSRCTATRQALLTGRYTWRTRLKYSVLWGPQGDPLIEPGRPTIASMLREQGYRSGMTGKWHCGLTYRDSHGQPAVDYRQDADLTRGLADGPLNHGFDFFHGTSRSHPTSAAQGWLYGDRVLAALGGKKVDTSQYVLNETGPKNFEMGMRFIENQLGSSVHRQQPFFLYYACHANHASHDPCDEIAGRKVKGQSHPGGRRSDFIFENDVALGLLLDFLESNDDPRRPGNKLIDNTLVIFTSDNGAESNKKSATGPIRSNKASCYEGGHRVPFIAYWKLGNVGDGNPLSVGDTCDFPICHVDLMATLAEIVDYELPANAAEDSFSLLTALRGKPPTSRPSIIHNDHKEGAPPNKSNDPTAAWLVIRDDHPHVEGRVFPGQWKLFVDHHLLMGDGDPRAMELYELQSDLSEQHNRLNDPDLQPLVEYLMSRLRTIHDGGRISVGGRTEP